ncbi:hypothetical protein ASF62_06770 [Leifsonia sp. Leaf325]|nr:MarR family winged helix-turn-helix transcriptional regulator [Leifsonia sp. Leaf325]KQQ93883.1 hypothetical protein ASF62_06770 [Leifsonia sp. Leaf325]
MIEIPPPDDRITVTLHHLMAQLDDFADGLLHERFGVSYSQFMFLAVLATLDLPDITTMGRCLGVSKAAVSKRLPSFVDAGWVELSGDPANSRRVLLALTPAGSRLTEDATTALDDSFTEVFTDITEVDLDQLHQQLKTVITVLTRKGM